MLARWSGWGAVPQVFDDTDDRYTTERDELRRLLGSDQAWAAARRTTLNAHYTGAEVVQAIWRTAQALGFTEGRVLEPGAGSGNFIGFAPAGASLTGVELDPTTAAVADHLYGARARIHTGGFEDFAEPDGAFDLVVGNVPFGEPRAFEPTCARSRRRFTRPGWNRAKPAVSDSEPDRSGLLVWGNPVGSR